MIPRLHPNKVRKIRDELHAKDPRCHWCGIVTIDPRSVSHNHKDSATLDHLRNRFQCTSAREYHRPSNYVLACYECNTLRDKIEMATDRAARERYEHEMSLRNILTGEHASKLAPTPYPWEKVL